MGALFIGVILVAIGAVLGFWIAINEDGND